MITSIMTTVFNLLAFPIYAILVSATLLKMKNIIYCDTLNNPI